MHVQQEGDGELLGWRDPDQNRKWLAENKETSLVDKRTSVQEAVKKYIDDGDLIASGGFGHVRVSMAIIYEIIRQRKKNLGMTGKTAVHDIDLLVGSGCVTRAEAAYSFGHELRGLSPASRRKIEGGDCEVVAELSNGAYQWRFLAAMMGVPFVPIRVMGGTDTFNKSSAKMVEDPWSGKSLCLVPACYPDVGIIHVHRCDKYGNAQIDGIWVEDFELAGASRRLILTTEQLMDSGEVRNNPAETVIPFYNVDAVVEVPYGSHPAQMPGEYYFDEDHISEWLDLSQTEEGAQEYFDKYVYGTSDFEEYLQIIGGEGKVDHLKRIEHLEERPDHPWAE